MDFHERSLFYWANSFSAGDTDRVSHHTCDYTSVVGFDYGLYMQLFVSWTDRRSNECHIQNEIVRNCNLPQLPGAPASLPPRPRRDKRGPAEYDTVLMGKEYVQNLFIQPDRAVCDIMVNPSPELTGSNQLASLSRLIIWLDWQKLNLLGFYPAEHGRHSSENI